MLQITFSFIQGSISYVHQFIRDKKPEKRKLNRSGNKRIKAITHWEFSFRIKCRWVNTTAITATRNSRILQLLGGVIFKVFNIKEPKLFGTTPCAIPSYSTIRTRSVKEYAITLFERGIASMGTPANIIIPSKTLKLWTKQDSLQGKIVERVFTQVVNLLIRPLFQVMCSEKRPEHHWAICLPL